MTVVAFVRDGSSKKILQAIQGIAQAYGRPEAEVLASFKDGGRIAELATQIRHRKVRELIRREAKVVGLLTTRTLRDRQGESGNRSRGWPGPMSSIERHRTCLSESWKAIPPPQRPSIINMKQAAQKLQWRTCDTS